MIFRASGLPRVMECNGSYALEAPYPDEEEEEAKEGTLAHEFAFMNLRYGCALNELDFEMYRAVTLYSNFCREFIKITTLWGVEVQHEIDLAGHILQGTTDFFAWLPDGTLVIIDFKYGHGWVEVRENWQLLAYAVLMWRKYGNGTEPRQVQLYVIQPRANHPKGPVRKWEFDGVLVRNYSNMIQNNISVASTDQARTISGEHCRYCKALIGCHTNQESLSHCIDVVGAMVNEEMTPESVARELDLLKAVQDRAKHRLEALEPYAIEKSKTGSIIPGYRATQSWSALKWNENDETTINKAIHEYDVDIRKPSQPFTPTQIIDRGILDEDKVKKLASRKPGAFKLKRESLTHAKELIKNAS